MRSVRGTINQLARLRRQWEEAYATGADGGPDAGGLAGKALGAAGLGRLGLGDLGLGDLGLGGSGDADAPARLTEVTEFGSNPGGLRLFAHVPETLPPNPALVVVLHGCTQTAVGYDLGAGWSTLADRYGFVVLAPEQSRSNNPKGCFNWFLPEDARRGGGEALSIRQGIERIVQDHGIDPSRIFVTGLSAGGAMTSVMLATYPEVFAGGAIIAGLPYGAAGTVQEAFESMFQCRKRPEREWGDLVRSASAHEGPWPRVSIWHGTADTTVVPANAGEIVKQWADLHGLNLNAASRDKVDGYPRRVWRGSDGTALIEEYTITGMAHGTPLAPTAGEVPHGTAGPFLLDVGIASSYHIATFWGLTEPTAGRRPDAEDAARAKVSQEARTSEEARTLRAGASRSTQEAEPVRLPPPRPASPTDRGDERPQPAVSRGPSVPGGSEAPALRPSALSGKGSGERASASSRRDRSEALRPGGVDIEGAINRALKAARLLKR